MQYQRAGKTSGDLAAAGNRVVGLPTKDRSVLDKVEAEEEKAKSNRWRWAENKYYLICSVGLGGREKTASLLGCVDLYRENRSLRAEAKTRRKVEFMG